MENITAYMNRHINRILGLGVLEDVIVDSITVSEQVHSALNKDGLLLFESKNIFSPIPGVRNYSYRIDKQQGAGGPGRQRHIHLYYNGEELFAMNVDATAHDGYHQVKIPDNLVAFLKNKGFSIPDNNIIELKQYNSTGQLLCENISPSTINKIAFDITHTIRQAKHITLFESNIEPSLIIWNSQIRNKNHHINKLVDIPQYLIPEIKFYIIEFLKSSRKYSDDIKDILDSSNAPHRLFVAWS